MGLQKATPNKAMVMTKLKQILYLLFMTLGFAWIPVLALAKQKLSLSSLFSDKMVLQQNKIEVNFEIAGDIKVYLQTEDKMSGNNIVVSNPKITNPVYVRYAWSDNSSTTLFNKEGLPVATLTSEK
jgi:sialate O-acetylesterase